MTNSQKFLFGFRLAILFACLYGLFLQLYPNEWHQLTYYTLQSNIAVASFLIYLLIKMWQNPLAAQTSTKVLRLKGAVTIAITLTFLVYAIMLAPIASYKDFYNWKNYLLHYIVPIGFILDWFFMDKVNAYKKYDPILWTIFPLLYVCFSLVKGYIFNVPIPDQKHSPYPYFFININQIGWSGFAMYFFAILTGYMLIGYFMLLIKKRKKQA